MPNAKNIIKAKENEEGKVIVRLYGQDIDVTSKIKDGKAEIMLYGQEYEILANTGDKKKPSAPKKILARAKLRSRRLSLLSYQSKNEGVNHGSKEGRS